MKISIVTVVFNNPMVNEALDSILAQQFDGELELIVIDGGSTDGTLKVLDQYRGRLAVLVSEPDKGIYDAMNKGLQMATGEVIGTLNSDDLYAGTKVLSKVREVFQDDSVQVSYGDLVYVRRDDPSRVVRFWQSGPFKEGAFAKGWVPPHPTFFVRRGVYERFGRFNLDATVAADFELMLRLMERYRLKCAYIPETLVRMRMGGHSNRSLKNIIRGNAECYRAFKRNGLPVSKLYVIRRLVRRVVQYTKRAEGLSMNGSANE